MLTKRDRAVLIFVEDYLAREGGVSPSCDDIASALGLSSKGKASDALAALEAQGFIRRLHQKARAIEVIKPTERKIPIYRSGDNKLMGFLP